MPRRSVAHLAASALVASVIALSACSSGGSSASSGAPSASGSVSKDAKATLRVWHYLGTANQATLLKEETALFNKQYPNVTVQNVYVPAEQLTQKILAATATGDGPDVIIGDPTAALTLASANALYDMSAFWGKFADAPQFPASVQIRASGKLVGLQGYVNTLALFYNKDELAKAHVQPPTTTGELKSALEAVKAAGYGGMTLCGEPTIECEFQAYPWLLGDGVTYAKYDAGKTGAVFGEFQSMLNSGLIPKEVVNWAQADAFEQWLTGKYAFTENGNWNLAQAHTDAKFKWGVVRLPAGTDGSHVVGGGEAESIGANSKNPALAWAYLQDTWLSKAGELLALTTNGSLPTRKDAAQDHAIAGDPSLTVFSQAVADSAAWPSNPHIVDARTDLGTAWSDVLSGQSSPASAATTLGSQLSQTLGAS